MGHLEKINRLNKLRREIQMAHIQTRYLQLWFQDGINLWLLKLFYAEDLFFVLF